MQIEINWLIDWLIDIDNDLCRECSKYLDKIEYIFYKKKGKWQHSIVQNSWCHI